MVITSNQVKYSSKNIFIRFAIRRFFSNIAWVLQRISFNNAVDVGCGEGFLGNYLRKMYGAKISLTGIDINYKALQTAHSMHIYNNVVQANIYELPIKAEAFDLVFCTEVLEHLLSTDCALRELRRVSRKFCLLSVPSENLLRFCRIIGLKNIAHLGKHPEHLVSFTKNSFCKMFERYFKVEVLRFSFPWVIILGSK